MALITVIAGGVGAAKFLRGLVEVVDPGDVTAVVNVADDFRLHGLAISPDLDTVTYTLADLVNPETGWGLQGESWTVIEELDHYGGATWFSPSGRSRSPGPRSRKFRARNASSPHSAKPRAQATTRVATARPTRIKNHHVMARAGSRALLVSTAATAPAPALTRPARSRAPGMHTSPVGRRG